VIEEIEVPPFPWGPRKFNQSALRTSEGHSNIKKRYEYFMNYLFGN
tara:strand:- start:422 stop:559 length:138 start_codon:yes stop_codon:yes gene_type:complete